MSRPNRSHAQFFFSVALALGLLGVSACTEKPPAEKPLGPESRLNQPLFGFQTDQVREFEIDKNDPTTGDHWSARLALGKPAAPFGPKDSFWTLTSTSQSNDLLDNRANDGFVVHLLDTLQTFRFSTIAPKGDLGSFGLQPPQFALRWRAEILNELLLGNLDESGSSIYALAPHWDAGPHHSDSTVYVAQGAAIIMLGNVKGLSYLRQEPLATFTSDDVEQFEMKSLGKSVLYAQRDGDQWRDRRHKPLKTDAAALLDALTHLRIQRFIDEAVEEKAKEAALANAKPFEADFTDLHGHLAVARAAQVKSEVLASISTRPGAVFVLYPEALAVFAPKR